MPAAKTACVQCRRVKMKCCWQDDNLECIRCLQNELACEVVPRRLGRQPGSKNRPKTLITGSSSAHPRRRPTEKQVVAASSSPRDFGDLGGLRDLGATHDSSATASLDCPLDLSSGADGTQTPERGVRASSASFNMLSVLARVANDQPAPTEPTPPNAEEEPFDRSAFLCEFLDEARHLDPDPYGGVAVLEEGLGELYKCEPYARSSAAAAAEQIVHSRIDQPRLDVSPAYDVVSGGIVSEAELRNLLDVYWRRIQPVGRVLDPEIHTEAYIRATSALLTSTMLTIAAQSLPVSEHANALVARLEAHVDFLLGETGKQGFQSIEICQALTLLCLFIGGHQIHRMWELTAKAIAIAVELRLDSSPPPPWALAPSPHHSATPAALARNAQRLWILVVDWDRACAFIRGRRPMIREPAYTSGAQLLEWSEHPDALGSDVHTAGCCALLDVVGRLQISAGRQLVRQSSTFDFEAHRANVDRELDAWREAWLPRTKEQDVHRSMLDVEGMRLILLMMPYEYGILRGWSTAATVAGRDVCLATAVKILTRALPIIAGTDPVLKVNSLYTYRYYRIAYAGFTILRILNTAPRARNDDVYLLSIVAALARRLIDARLHSNFASITVILGRRLLHAARQLGAGRLGVSSPICSTVTQSIPGALDPGLYPLLDLVWGSTGAAPALGSGTGNETPAVGDLAGMSLDTLPLFAGYNEGIFSMLDPLEFGRLDDVGAMSFVPLVDE